MDTADTIARNGVLVILALVALVAIFSGKTPS